MSSKAIPQCFNCVSNRTEIECEECIKAREESEKVMKRDKSILQEDMSKCYICGKPAVHIHEIFFGTANRKNSIKWGCYVGLCYEHHEGNTGAHLCHETDLKLKTECENAFEEKYGREKFKEVFGKFWT